MGKSQFLWAIVNQSFMIILALYDLEYMVQ